MHVSVWVRRGHRPRLQHKDSRASLGVARAEPLQGEARDFARVL
jgi:hypothetical protein